MCEKFHKQISSIKKDHPAKGSPFYLCLGLQLNFKTTQNHTKDAKHQQEAFRWFRCGESSDVICSAVVDETVPLAVAGFPATVAWMTCEYFHAESV